jgi:hypothetical protein
VSSYEWIPDWTMWIDDVVVDEAGRVLQELGDPADGWSPTAVATVEDTSGVWVADGYGLSVVHRFDEHGRHVQTLGANPDAPKRDGWPNARDANGDVVRPPLEPRRFNSPHTLTADREGNLFVTEWLLGGRLTKLAKM